MGVRRGGQASECADTAGNVISDSPWNSQATTEVTPCPFLAWGRRGLPPPTSPLGALALWPRGCAQAGAGTTLKGSPSFAREVYHAHRSQ
jgi:hypothetical protein